MPAKKLASMSKADKARIEEIRKEVGALEVEMAAIVKEVAKRDAKRGVKRV